MQPRLDKQPRQSQSSTVIGSGKRARMKPTPLVHPQRLFALALLISCAAGAMYAQNEPILVPDVVDYAKLLPILPDAPPGWTADKPEGSTEDVGGFRITSVNSYLRIGQGDKTLDDDVKC